MTDETFDEEALKCLWQATMLEWAKELIESRVDRGDACFDSWLTALEKGPV